MNGFGGMPGPYYNTAGPSPLPNVPQTALPVFTGNGTAPWATDTPALIPTPAPVVEPVWFDPQAPLVAPDPFENWPSPLLQPPGPELPYIPDAGLPPVLQPILQTPGLEEKFGGYPEQPVVYEPGEAYEIPPSGPLEFVADVIGNTVEFAGDVLKTGLDVVWDTGKFILEHLEVGIGYAGDITGTVSQQRYYEQLGEAQKTAAEAAETRARAYAELVAQGKMSQEEAIARGMAYGMESMKGIESTKGLAAPVIYETPASKQLSDYMPLAIAAVAAILLFKKGKI